MEAELTRLLSNRWRESRISRGRCAARLSATGDIQLATNNNPMHSASRSLAPCMGASVVNKTTVASQAKTASSVQPAQGMLQRKCACGNHTVAGGECAECAKNKRWFTTEACHWLQATIRWNRKPIGSRIRCWQRRTHPAVSGAPPRIQRFSGQANGQMQAAPASVDRVLASSGRPLDPALQQDMGQRFGHDFSRVRVHSGAAAEQSARDVNANAYTVGHNIVFGGSSCRIQKGEVDSPSVDRMW